MPATNTLLAVAVSCLLVACHAKQATEATTATAPKPVARPDSVNQASATPGMQRWRINDTLTLECSHPLATFVTEEQPVPQPVWGQLALRGQRGWYKLLADNMYWTLYHVSVAPDGTLFQLPTVGVEDKISPANKQVQKPIKLTEEDLFYNTYDVPRLTWTEYLDQDLVALPARQIEPDYLGGEVDDKLYYPLPYWLAQEKKRLSSTRHLPTADRLAAYLELSQDTTRHTGRLLPPYKGLLADLLQAYQAYPMAADTLQLLRESLRSLSPSARRKDK